jgi:hypothetical protein
VVLVSGSFVLAIFRGHFIQVVYEMRLQPNEFDYSEQETTIDLNILIIFKQLVEITD